MNRVDRAIAEASAAVDCVTKRYGISDYEIVQRIELERFWEKQKRKQNRENFFKWLMIVAACVIVIVFALVASGHASELPNAPSLTMRGPVETYAPNERMIVHNTPSYSPKLQDPLKDWKFWAGTGVLVGAMLYDQQQTLDGLKHTGCVEANGDNPHPTRGDLMRRNTPFVAGITGFKYVLAKYAHVPFWSYSVGDAVGSYVHIHSGLEWNACL